MLPFCGLSICLSVTFVHCAQTAEDIDTISFAYDSPCLSQIVLKCGLQIGQHIPPQIWPQMAGVGDDRRQIGTRNNAMVTMETAIALSNGTIADPLRPPLVPKWRS